MRTLRNFLLVSLLGMNALQAQTPVNLVNFDFNSSGSFPYAANATANGVSCSLTSNTTFTLVTGINTSGSAFYTNTQGTGLAIPDYAGDETTAKYYLFQVGGSNLYAYENYKLYFQTNRTATGASTMAVQYSTDGSNFTHFNYYDIPTGSYAYNINMTGINALNGSSAFYIKLKIYEGSTGGVCRFDNFQVQGMPVVAGGSNQSGWQVSSTNMSTMKNLGIGTSSPAVPLDVIGEAKISGNATVGGELNANSLSFGAGLDKVTLNTTVINGARVIGLGGVVQQPSNSCMTPINGTSFQAHRMTVVKPLSSNSNNMLDFTNDGINGSIDYGFDINQFQVFDPNNPTPPRPALKLNGLCWGDVEIAKGGGFASMGSYLEVGSPTRAGNITSNIKSNTGRIGQRIVAGSTYPESYATPTPAYNSQFYVNISKMRALAVFNTGINSGGDETFSVFGDGKAQINAVTQTNNYIVVSDVSTPTTPVEAFAVTGKGYVRINTPNTTQVASVFNVHDITNNIDLFRINSDGHVYAREVEIKAISLAFPDYVFAKDYKRLSFSELEQFIAKNKHLPGYEKAEYYETNGIKTTEMFVKQQETIENLTLYILELEKRLKALEESKR